jgi:hypothetical protein
MATRFGRKDFLEALFGNYLEEKSGFIRMLTQRQGDRRIATRYFPKIESLAKEVFPEDQHVYVGVCPHENMKPDKAVIRYMTALWAGLDVGPDGYSGKTTFFKDVSEAAKAVRSFPLPPSMVVESGRGVHLYWLLREVTPIDDVQRVESLLTRISHYYQCKRPITVDSVLRMPGTTNCRIHTQLLPCTIKYINSGFVYDLEEFENLPLPVFLGGPARKSAGGTSQTPAREDVPTEPAAQERKGEAPADYEDMAAYFGMELTPTQVAQIDPPPEEHVQEGFVRLYDEADISQEVVAPPEEVMGTSAAESSVMAELVDEPSPETIANEIVDKVVDRLTGELMDKLVDEIVEKLYERIFANQAKK